MVLPSLSSSNLPVSLPNDDRLFPFGDLLEADGQIVNKKRLSVPRSIEIWKTETSIFPVAAKKKLAA